MRFVVLAALAFLLGGCGAATQNVRAYRAYMQEDPNVKVAIDRVEDVAVTLELVDRILLGTTYTPGDQWPRRLGMTDAQFRVIKEQLRARYPYKGLDNVEVPILKCYRSHVEHTLVEYGPPPEKAKYPSLLDAVGALTPRNADIKKHWIAYRDATQKLADASDEEDRVSRELAGLSVTQRHAREGELPDLAASLVRRRGEAVVQPPAEVLDRMSNLARALKSDVEKSPGFELTESVVDQIVGITLDSFRVDLHAGGDMLIYSSVGEADRKGDDYDFRGRRFKLDYRIDPIILASARLDVVLDWIRLPGAANVGFGYSTDRVFKSGGEVTTTSLTQQLGITGVASDVIDAGLGILGIRSSVKVASFTAGEVRQVQATNVSNAVAASPLKLKITQIDVGYDLLWVIDNEQLKAYTEELVVGARYYEYSLPRIVYELEDTSTVAGKEHFTFARETPAQDVKSRFYMLSVAARFGVGDAPRWSPYLDLGFAGGAGPTSFYFTPDPLVPAGPRDTAHEAAIGLNGSSALGLRLRLLPRGSRVRLDLRGEYRGSMIYTIVTRDATRDGRALRTDFGQFDVFHGPSLAIRGSL